MLFRHRLFTQVNMYKDDFNKVAVFMVANYIDEVQRVNLLIPVKVRAAAVWLALCYGRIKVTIDTAPCFDGVKSK